MSVPPAKCRLCEADLSPYVPSLPRMCRNCGQVQHVCDRWDQEARDAELSYRAMAAGFNERCKITGNPCGTDTWADGHPCRCATCSEYLETA